MSWWLGLLIAVWLGVALALAVSMPRSRGCLAYRATGEESFYWIGRFFTMLHWPIVVPVVIVLLIQELREWRSP